MAPGFLSAATSLLVANPAARTGRAAAVIDRALTALAARDLAPELMATGPEGDAVGRIAERVGRGDVGRVVYLGGDGTFADAAKGILRARAAHGIDVPLGMLPMGTANNQGLSFGIRPGANAIERNVEIISRHRRQPIDVGEIRAYDRRGRLLREDRWFDTCGFGLSAQVLALRNRDLEAVERVPLVRRVYRDHMVYLRAFVSEFAGTLVRDWRFSGAVTVDGERFEHDNITDIIVLGTLLYGGEWILSPQTQPDDGKFEVLVVPSHADFVTSGLRGLKRTPVPDDGWIALGYGERRFPAGSHIIIELDPAAVGRWASRRSERPVLAQIDGEEFPAAVRYELTNVPRSLDILVPEDPRWI